MNLASSTVKELEEELSRLKRMYTELSMENDAMKAAIQRSGAPDEKREIVQALNEQMMSQRKASHIVDPRARPGTPNDRPMIAC
ncbi:MAG: hypothetical protein IPG69_18405 [Flavobacteriales bacterium]|nr:hypothetical protein [Flavobacteriales bacterium]